MTIKEKLKLLIKELNKKNITNPQLEAELIIAIAINTNRENIILNHNKKLLPQEIIKINKITKKRVKGYPLAYISGNKDFYNLNFIVNKNTLIPRPESELIIDTVLKKINKKSINKKTIIDVGTGSGCLIITLANILKNQKNIDFFAIDIKNKTLKIAKKNAVKNKIDKKIIFLRGNLLEPIIKNIKSKNYNKKSINKETKIELIILANLPYLTKKEIKNSNSIKFEPYKALYGGQDGLKYYSQLLQQIMYLKNENNKILIFQEINPWQKEKLKEMTIKKLGVFSPKIKTIPDLRGDDRLVVSEI